jgi:serine/threonine protein kinase
VGKYKYDPKDELGRGFSGKVYKGVEIDKPQRRYAIKVVSLQKFKGHSLDMLQSEIDIQLSLSHEHIVKLH